MKNKLMRLTVLFLTVLMLSAIVTVPVAAAGTTTTAATTAATTTTTTASPEHGDPDPTFWEKIGDFFVNAGDAIVDFFTPNPNSNGTTPWDEFMGGLGGIAGSLGSIEDILSNPFGVWIPWLRVIYDLICQLLTTTFFANRFVSFSLDFFGVLGGILLTVGFVKNLIVCAEKRLHGEPSNPAEIIVSTLKAYGLLIFCQPVVKSTHALCTNLLTTILAGFAPDTTLNITFVGVSASAVISIILCVCSCIVLINTFRYHGEIYVKIFTGYLTVFDVAGGNDGAIGEWGRDVFGRCIGFAFQLLFYHLGAFYAMIAMSSGDVHDILVSCVFLIGAATVPTMLKRWGYATNQRRGGGLNALVHGAAAALRFVA